MVSMWKGIIEAYREYLPVSEKTPVISIAEGNTPLILARYLSQLVGGDVYLKYEGLNPTGSFKDRGMTMAVSKAREEGAKAVICASTGNTAASAAAYAARADIPCYVIIPKGKVALGKIAGALAHGAHVLAIDGNFDQALEAVRYIAARSAVAVVNSINPYRLQGQKTASFEVCDELGDAPSHVFIPVGNAGNISAYWMGFKEYHKHGKITRTPQMMGFQAEGAAPLVLGKVIESPETCATAIRIGNPANWNKALTAVAESGGQIAAVSDQEILQAHALLASREGVFVEPASAASVAGLLSLRAKIQFTADTPSVCILTGHGLKDPDAVLEKQRHSIKEVPADRERLFEIIVGDGETA